MILARITKSPHIAGFAQNRTDMLLVSVATFFVVLLFLIVMVSHSLAATVANLDLPENRSGQIISVIESTKYLRIKS